MKIDKIQNIPFTKGVLRRFLSAHKLLLMSSFIYLHTINTPETKNKKG